MRTVAIINQKGGCGKTTTAINLGAALARAGQRTLIVDLDPQGHCALGLAIPESHIEVQVGDAMLTPDRRPLDASRMLWRVARDLDLLPSTTRLAALEAARGGLSDREDRDRRLASVLERFAPDYDWCLVDCPPFIGLLTFNAIRAASEVLIPVETAYFALHGAAKQANTIRAVGRKLGFEIPYRVLPTLCDQRNPLSRDVMAELERRFEEKLLPVFIRVDPKLREAASSGMPVLELDPACDGARDYAALAAYMVSVPAPQIRPIEPEPELEIRAEPDTLSNSHPASSGVHPAASTMGIEPKDGPFEPGERSPLPGGPQFNPPVFTPSAFGAPVFGSPAFGAPPRITPPHNGTRAAELAARARRLMFRPEDQPRRPLAIDGPDESSGAVTPALAATPPAPTLRLEAPFERSSTGDAGVVVTPRGVYFRCAASPDARASIAGDHNDWSPDATPLRYNPRTGLFEALLPLPPGCFRYQLVINGHWQTDPANPLTERDAAGALNSVVVVPDAAAAALPPHGTPPLAIPSQAFEARDLGQGPSSSQQALSA